MDSPQKQAGSTMGSTLFPDAVRLVGLWALFTACLFLASMTITCATTYGVDHYYHVPGKCVEGDEWIWMLYCMALQTAAAALALLLPGRHRRVRHALAYLAIAAAIVGHYMLVTTTVRLALALEPYLMYLFAMVSCTLTIVCFASGDLISFLALLLALGGED